MATSAAHSTVASVERALAVLLLFRNRSSMRVTDVAEQLGTTRSTAHRLLTTLVSSGFAVQDSPGHAYRPGPQLIEVGLGVLAGLDIRRRARPYLERLADQTGETVSLLVPEDHNVRFVDSIESTNAVRVASRFGLTFPAHATSGGKAMLAALGPEMLEELYPTDRLERITAATLPNRRELILELGRVRAAGYAFNTQESEPGLAAAGVAILDHCGRPSAAVTAAGPAHRLAGEHRRKIVRALRQAATAIAAALYE